MLEVLGNEPNPVAGLRAMAKLLVALLSVNGLRYTGLPSAHVAAVPLRTNHCAVRKRARASAKRVRVDTSTSAGVSVLLAIVD